MVMKFHNVDIFYKICYISDMLSALACRMKSITICKTYKHNGICLICLLIASDESDVTVYYQRLYMQ